MGEQGVMTDEDKLELQRKLAEKIGINATKKRDEINKQVTNIDFVEESISTQIKPIDEFGIDATDDEEDGGLELQTNYNEKVKVLKLSREQVLVNRFRDTNNREPNEEELKVIRSAIPKETQKAVKVWDTAHTKENIIEIMKNPAQRGLVVGSLTLFVLMKMTHGIWSATFFFAMLFCVYQLYCQVFNKEKDKNIQEKTIVKQIKEWHRRQLQPETYTPEGKLWFVEQYGRLIAVEHNLHNTKRERAEHRLIAIEKELVSADQNLNKVIKLYDNERLKKPELSTEENRFTAMRIEQEERIVRLNNEIRALNNFLNSSHKGRTKGGIVPHIVNVQAWYKLLTSKNDTMFVGAYGFVAVVFLLISTTPLGFIGLVGLGYCGLMMAVIYRRIAQRRKKVQHIVEELAEKHPAYSDLLYDENLTISHYVAQFNSMRDNMKRVIAGQALAEGAVIITSDGTKKVNESAYNQVWENLFAKLKIEPEIPLCSTEGKLTHFDFREIESRVFYKNRERIEKAFKLVIHEIKMNKPNIGCVRLSMLSGEMPTEYDFDKIYMESGSIFVGLTPLGNTYWDYITKPHALISGATGGGKTVLTQSIIAQLMDTPSKYPRKIDFVDLKDGADFSFYQDKGYKVLTKPEELLELLKVAQIEYENRASLLKDSKCRTLRQYHDNGSKDIPEWWIFVDEYASVKKSDCSKEVFAELSNLLSKTRWTGIYFVLLLQRATGDTLGGQEGTTIKDNCNLKALPITGNKAIDLVFGAEYKNNAMQKSSGKDGLGWWWMLGVRGSSDVEVLKTPKISELTIEQTTPENRYATDLFVDNKRSNNDGIQTIETTSPEPIQSKRLFDKLS